jgi:hypothetical protein
MRENHLETATYPIARPSFLMLKLEETQHVTVRIVALPRS